MAITTPILNSSTSDDLIDHDTERGDAELAPHLGDPLLQ